MPQSIYDELVERVNECGRILAALIRSLEEKKPQ
jgi:hypothetical protein